MTLSTLRLIAWLLTAAAGTVLCISAIVTIRLARSGQLDLSYRHSRGWVDALGAVWALGFGAGVALIRLVPQASILLDSFAVALAGLLCLHAFLRLWALHVIDSPDLRVGWASALSGTALVLGIGFSLAFALHRLAHSSTLDAAIKR